jgi:hypothetical protein
MASNTATGALSHFVSSMPAPVASGWSDRRVGLAPTGKRRLVTAHVEIGHSHQIFLPELSDCSANAGTALRKILISATDRRASLRSLGDFAPLGISAALTIQR